MHVTVMPVMHVFHGKKKLCITNTFEEMLPALTYMPECALPALLEKCH
jgi:hypothetical protein